LKIIVKPDAPKPEVVAEEVYVYSGEKNYEPPKTDPWVVEEKK
jgi:hypothetical protein